MDNVSSSPLDQLQIIENLTIRKGVTLKQLVAINADLRKCLLFGEVRRAHPGRRQSDFYTVSTDIGQKRIVINSPEAEDEIVTLKTLNVREDDLVTIKGAGIDNAKVEAVSGRAIFINQTASRTLKETRMSIRSPVLASFTFLPKNEVFKISTTETSQKSSTQLNIAGFSIIAPNGQNLVFNQYKSLSVTRTPFPLKSGTDIVFQKNGLPFQITTSSDSGVGAVTLNVRGIQESLPQGSSAIIGSSTVVTRDKVRKGQRIIACRPLKAPIPKDSILNFGYKDVKGWRQVAVVKTSDPVLENSLVIPIYSYEQATEIPANSIAYYGTSPINNVYLILESGETEAIDTGDDYACDIISVDENGFVKKIVEISQILFSDTWTDVA